MLISLNRRGENRLYHPFFTRTEVHDANLTTTQSYCYKYNLTGIARNNTCGLEIYQAYFPSKYNHHYEQERRRNTDLKLEQRHVSMFFKPFIKLIVIKSLVWEDTTEKVNGFTNDFFGHNRKKDSNRREEEINNLINCLKPAISRNIKQVSNQKKQLQKTHTNIELMSKLIENLLKKLRIDIEKQDKISQQILPEFLSKLTRKKTKDYIIHNFSKIIEIQVFKTTAKKDILQLFLDINRNFMMVKIPFIMQSSMKPKEKQTANQIILPRYTSEKYIIASKLTQKSKNIQYGNQLQQTALRTQFELIKDLVAYLCKYNKYTNHFYPNVTSSDIYFDEKKLKVFLTHHPLILDGIGISKKSKPLQLQLACQPTPQFDFQQCHLEWQNRQRLKQKYYFPGQYRRKIDENDDQSPENSKKSSLIQRLEQRIHVWRIINIIYQISNNRKMTNSLYPYYRTNQPIELSSYKQVAKQIYQDLSKSAQSLIKLLPPIQFQLKCAKSNQLVQQYLQKQQKKMVAKIIKGLSNKKREDEMNIIKTRKQSQQYFQFSLKNIRQKFKFPDDDDEDSLLQDLKILSLKSEIFLRTIIVKQISFLLLDKKAFKKVSNAKKYLLLYFTYMFQDVYLMQLSRKNKKMRTTFKQQLKAELQKQYNGMNISQQFEKRRGNRNNCLQKLMQYVEREYDDNNKTFLINNTQYMWDVDQIQKKMNQIDEIELIQSEYFFKTKPNQQQIETLFQEKSKFLTAYDTQTLAWIKSEVKLTKCLQDLEVKMNQHIQPENQRQEIIGSIAEQIYTKIIRDSEIRKDILLHQFFSILLQNSKEVNIANAITHLNQQHKLEDLKNQSKDDLVCIFSQSLNKNTQALLSKQTHIKSIISIDEQNFPQLMHTVHSLIDKVKKSKVFEQFKDNWNDKIQQRMAQSHELIMSNLDKLVTTQIQPHVKNPQGFHKLSDFNGNVEACLYYNHKLLTLMKIYLKMNGQNWKGYERVYNMLQIEDKTVNFRTQLKNIDACDKNDIKLATHKLEILRNTPFKVVQELYRQEINQPYSHSLKTDINQTKGSELPTYH